jgi:hypothetical protein
MNYVYPKLSDHDLGFVRLGGAGLGNILFTFARAAVFAEKNGYELIWPTWPSIKLGPILRHEADKRFYHDLFRNRSGYIGGIRKLWKLKTLPHVPEQEKESLSLQNETIVDFEGFEGCFDEIMTDYEQVAALIYGNLCKKNQQALHYPYGSCIGVHIRLGDFARVSVTEVQQGRHDSALPVEWYARMISQIREAAGWQVKAYIFSDGTDQELAPVLALDGVERLTFGTSIGDIIGLAQTDFMIASGSSFSMWARYLGRKSCICYPNQRKQQILTPEESEKEWEIDGAFPEDLITKIQQVFPQ